MAGIRLTGLVSGLDTESLVQQLSEAYQKKVDNVKKKQTKAEWKKEAWASLNTKIYDFYKGSLATFKSSSTYNTKAVSGTLSGVKVTASTKAANGTHKVEVKEVASAQMWTGSMINTKTYTATSYTGATDTTKKLSELYDQNGNSITDKLDEASFTVNYTDADGNAQSRKVELSVDGDTTVDTMLTQINNELNGTGLSASFANGALKFSNETAQKTGDGEDATYTGGYAITVTADTEASAKALGLTYGEDLTIKQLSKENDVNIAGGSSFANEKVETEGASVTGATKLVDLGIAEGTKIKLQIGSGEATEIEIGKTTTLNNLASSLANAGINASYDANQGRFYLSSKDTGLENAFTITAEDSTGSRADVLNVLGLGTNLEGKIDAAGAIISYNGVDYPQSGNSFSINGLTIEATEKGSSQTFSVSNDVDGIYNKVKEFIKSYNTLISEMNTLYNADSARDYDPLTSDEKEAMSDDEVEQWEKKIKDSLLRRDSTISSLLSSMRTTLSKSVDVTNADGTTSKYSLASLGIVTGQYTEKGQLHIKGDSEDADYADYEDKLKKAIAENPEAVTQTLTKLGNEIYTNLQKAMKKTELSSALTFYNDIQMDNEIEDYKDEVTKLQEKLQEEEDRYYDQFAAMESAMSRLQSQQTYISQLFGG